MLNGAGDWGLGGWGGVGWGGVGWGASTNILNLFGVRSSPQPAGNPKNIFLNAIIDEPVKSHFSRIQP